MNLDLIMIAYLDMQILQEMAGKVTNQDFLKSEDERKTLYHTAIKLPIKTKKYGVTIHSNPNGRIKMATKGDEVVYYSLMDRIKKDDLFPVDHHHQSLVAQGGDSPKGLARNLALDSIDELNSPLRTSYNQSPAGHQMWRKLVPEAMDRRFASTLLGR